jgi:hypothetical protein
MTAGLHDHRRGDDRPTRRRHADFVDTGDPASTLVPQAALMAEAGNDQGHRPSG